MKSIVPHVIATMFALKLLVFTTSCRTNKPQPEFSNSNQHTTDTDDGWQAIIVNGSKSAVARHAVIGRNGETYCVWVIGGGIPPTSAVCQYTFEESIAFLSNLSNVVVYNAPSTDNPHSMSPLCTTEIKSLVQRIVESGAAWVPMR